MVQLTFFSVHLKKMNVWRAHILEDERRTGTRDLEARRAFNRALTAGRANTKKRLAMKKDPTSPEIRRQVVCRQERPQNCGEKAKDKACTEGGMCKHSARKMQWAVQYYKSHGGTYAGKKSPSNKLHQWTKQKWRTASGKKSEGKRRYLPAEALEAPDQEADQGDEPAEAERVREREAVGEAAEGRARVAKKYRRLRK